MALKTLRFEKLWIDYPDPDTVNHDKLFEILGWDDLKNDKRYNNTCAIRMNYCLAKSGVRLPGRFQIKKGPYKGFWIEPGQVTLSNTLARSEWLGAPKKCTIKERDSVLDKHTGIVSFMRIPGYVVDGALSGHIDLVRHGQLRVFGWTIFDWLKCASECYWSAAEYWFWPIK